MAADSATVHASAVLVGARAVLIRGPSASGKSRLALELLEAARTGVLRFARLVADDRVHLEAVGGRLLARPPEALAGLIEVRGVGLLRVAHEPRAVIGLVVDLDAPDAGTIADGRPATYRNQRYLVTATARCKGFGGPAGVLALLNSTANNWS